MREEFMIERQGKRFVLYAGLLNEAHERGLRGIETDLVHTEPWEGEIKRETVYGTRAIVKAVVEMEDGRTFSGIGDADPGNVGSMIAPHVIRMAETRAKARALRDAVNVGVASIEELGGDDGEDKAVDTGRNRGGYGADSRAENGGQNRGQKDDLPATQKQLNYLKALVEDVVEDGVGKFENMVGKPFAELTRGEASEWIGRLSGRAVPEGAGR